ncbi:MAG TPA: hypothetical protein VN478_01655, partial [Clostridia bacterium]|nr:hypothetical protein [Clostridia bacterium]
DPGIYYSDGHLMDGNKPLQLLPFDSVCLRKTMGDDVELLGTTTHLFPGLDIASFHSHERSIVLRQSDSARLEGEALIGVPDGSDGWTVNGAPIAPERQGARMVLRVPLMKVALPVD